MAGSTPKNPIRNFLPGVIAALCFAAAYFFIFRPCIGPICVDKNVPVLSKAFEGDRPLAFYQSKADRLAVVASIFLVLAFVCAAPLKRLVIAFFKEKDSPWNLAVFRIVLFGFVLWYFDKSKVLWFSQLPPEMMFPPAGCKFLLAHIPVNPSLANILSDVFVLSCFMALVGFFPRVFGWIAVLTGWYVLGIPNFYGKVDHPHHLLWFMAILSSSPCWEVLSLSSIPRAIRRADEGYPLGPPKPSVRFGLPLRFIWFLMGIIYFFAGFWKFAKSQWHWALSDNLKHQMYAKWFELGGWTPAFRIDQHPWMYKLSGLLTILFEVSFIVLILFPFLRLLAAAGGLMFHNMTYAFMNILFLRLQICYAAFLNWAGIFSWIGKRLFKDDLYVLYDGNCKICRRTIAILQRFDMFGRIVYVNALDHAELKRLGLGWADTAELFQDMHAISGTAKWKGYDAYRKLTLRIPLFWPIWPLLWVPPVPQIGAVIYRKVADSRMCSVRKAVPTKEDGAEDPKASSFLTAVGVTLIAFNVLFGLAHQIKAWPFGCYPTFAGIVENPEIETVDFVGVMDDGEELIDISLFRERMAPHKYASFVGQTLRDNNKERKAVRLRKFVESMKQAGVDFSKYSKVRFYRTIRSTVPEKYSDGPITRELIFELDVAGK